MWEILDSYELNERMKEIEEWRKKMFRVNIIYQVAIWNREQTWNFSKPLYLSPLTALDTTHEGIDIFYEMYMSSEDEAKWNEVNK